jgi:hypothetical protein
VCAAVAEGVRRAVNHPGRDLLPGRAARHAYACQGFDATAGVLPSGSARGGVHPEGERWREQRGFSGGRVSQGTVADLSEYGVPHVEADWPTELFVME